MKRGKVNGFTETTVWLSDSQAVNCPVAWFKSGVKPWLPKADGIEWIKQRGKHQRGYQRVYAGFDIETTNIVEKDRKRGYMYLWQCAVVTDREGVVWLGRTWDEWLELMDAMVEWFGVTPQKRLIVWDANLGFEFQFMRKRIEWSREPFDFFAKEQRAPLVATTTDGIEFRECLSISGGSLAQLAKDFTKTRKLVGDLDYSVRRNAKTKLTKVEIGYSVNDVVILAEWSAYVFREYIAQKVVPITKTGLLRVETKGDLKDGCSDWNGYLELLRFAFPSEAEYKRIFRYLFRGGYVHGNLMYINRLLRGLDPYDIRSSYPDSMLTFDGFPVTPWKREPFDPAKLLTHACYMVVEFEEIHNRTHHSIESLHKAIVVDGVRLDNGRIYHADRLVVMLTELDLANYERFYSWKRMRVHEFYTAKRGRLPKPIRDVIAKYYVRKAELKAKGLGKTPEYSIAKSQVNSGYGLMVTRMQLDQVVYDVDADEWALADVPLVYESEVKRQVLLPQWGIYVAAKSRYNLLQVVADITERCGDIVVYNDTDSIKMLEHPEAEAVIREYNRRKAERLVELGYTDPAFEGLGGFDYEGKISRFKTLGAKRYLSEHDGVIEATVAGLPKSVIKSIEDPFETFSAAGFTIPIEDSDKLTTSYVDEWSGEYVEGEWMEEESSVCLYGIPFSLKTERDYYAMICAAPDARRRIIGSRDGG